MRNYRFIYRVINTAFLSLLLTSACQLSEPIDTPVPPTGTEAATTPVQPTATPFSPPSSATPPPSATVTVLLSPTPTEESPSFPYFEPAECRFDLPGVPAECGDLFVPEDRSNPESTTVSLHFAIFPSYSPDPEPDPVIYLMGGGGGNALGSADYYLRTVGNKIRASRDFILYNQRGTHYNQPFLACPGEKSFNQELDAKDIKKEEAAILEEDFLAGCRDFHLEKGVDLSMYNSLTNAADAEDLRLALGYQQVNYYGTSYGTRLGLTLMRYYPEGIRSVILDSVFPPNIDYPSGIIASFTGAVDRLFETCAADPTCSVRYLDLEETYYQVVEDLHANPGSITINGNPVVIDDELFLDLIYMALHPASAIPDIPNAIVYASQRDFGPLKWAVEYIIGYSENVATGVYYSSLCRDELGFDSYENTQAAAAGLHPRIAAYYDLSSFFNKCALWPAGQSEPIENQAVVSDIPALILAGYYDPITSPEWSQLAAETLTNSYYYEFPNMGHGVMRADPCGLSIGLAFLTDPSAAPNATCLDALTYPVYK